MLDDDFNFLRITTVFDSSPDHWSSQLYSEVIRHTIRRILPPGVFTAEESSLQTPLEKLSRLRSLLPYVAWSEFGQAPFNLSFFLLCNYRANAFKFFFEMISRWLVPGKRLNVVVFFAADFRLPDFSEDVYTVVEVEVRLETQKDVETVRKNLPIVATEIRLGADSTYHAIRLLEVKGLSMDEKTAMIQESIAALIKRRPEDFDFDIFSEAQHFLVTCSEDFKKAREYQHMSRIICFHYLFRKALKQALDSFPERRHLSLKFIKARLHLSSGTKTVWGILIAMNLFGDLEVFEERHLLKAVQSFLPEARMVEDSLHVNRLRSDQIRMLYLEIEKNDENDFTPEEIMLLRRELPNDLKGRIERRVHPIFMPRNEEEIMRHIVTLSNQLKFVKDLPQVILSFDDQTDDKLSFTVILLRLLQQGSRSIPELFALSPSFLEYFPDRTKIVSYLRKKYAKEASVFHVKLDKGQFLREDHSVDLYKARQVVITELSRVIGEVRDYNGGMISKQSELFEALKELLGAVATHNALVLENFFYSITPVVMRSVLEPQPLKNLFLLLLDTLEDGFYEHAGYSLKFQQEGDYLYMMIMADDASFKDSISYVIDQLGIPSLHFAAVSLSVSEVFCYGVLYRCDEKEKRFKFCSSIEKAMESWDAYAHNGTNPLEQGYGI